MFGPPKDVDGECNAHLYVADDYGDNTATVRCQLRQGHSGSHVEEYSDERTGRVRIEWEKDERAQPATQEAGEVRE